jgi:hypothetical protein
VEIDPAVAKKLVEHIQRKWKNGCPMCGARTWDLSGFSNVGIKKDIGPSMALGGPALPCACVICQTCGNTVLINLIVAGVMAKDG